MNYYLFIGTGTGLLRVISHRISLGLGLNERLLRHETQVGQRVSNVAEC